MADSTSISPAASPEQAGAAPQYTLGGPHLIVSPSPHFHTAGNVSSIMIWVTVALLPSCIAGTVFFGLPALRVLALCVAASLAFEFLCVKAMKRPFTLRDASALVTGLLLGMNLPSSTPWWICVTGAFFAIVIGKMIFGGLGCNPFNPALVGRVALLISFPAVMTTWPSPHPCGIATQTVQTSGSLPSTGATPAGETSGSLPSTGATPADAPSGMENGGYAITCATPLKYSKGAKYSHTAKSLVPQAPWIPQYAADRSPAQSRSALQRYTELFLGIGKGGSLGETCGLTLLLGGLLLIALNIIRWQIPVSYLATVFIITGIAHLCSPNDYAPPLFHLLTGGLLLGAFFMATDMVTTPLSRTGAIVFGIGCGIITAAIRLKGSYPEGVSFAILIMNAFTALIDRFTAGRPFGMPRKKGLDLAA